MDDKDYDWLWLLLVFIAVVVVIFLGVTQAVRRTFKPSQKPALDSSSTLIEQRRRTEQIKDNYTQMMQDQKQRVRDMQQDQKQRLRDLQRQNN